MAVSPFVWFESASYSKKDLLKEQQEKDYIPYLMNRAFSFHLDTVLYANTLNQYPNIDKKLQYHFYLHGIPSKRRFSKWPKTEVIEDIKLVQEIFNCNEVKAKEYLSVIDLEILNRYNKEQLHKNGV